jgi:type VI protein secretion system component VasK
MPLPEDEERQLQEIEQALYRDDPKFGRRMRASDPQVRYKRELIAAQLGIVIGVGLLPAGAVTHRVYLLAAGVVIVLLSLVCAVVSWQRYMARVRPARSGTRTATAKGTKHQLGQTRRARMMKRMQERWRRRQEGDGGMPGRTRAG